jgi:hypothetical protein
MGCSASKNATEVASAHVASRDSAAHTFTVSSHAQASVAADSAHAPSGTTAEPVSQPVLQRASLADGA